MTNYYLKYNKAIAILALTAAGVAACVSAQAPSTRHIDVTVTESSGRIVTGLEREDFTLIENGVHQAITRFVAARSPISLAIVSKEPVPAAEVPIPADELIQTASLSDALRQFRALPNSRKAIVTTAEGPLTVPPDIELVTVNRDSVAKVVAELRNQYRLEFESEMSSTMLKSSSAPRPGLPQLKVNWK